MTIKTSLSRRLRRLARQEDGAVAITVAIILPVMFGMVGLVEASRVYGVKNQLQTTADAAAMASVHHVPTLADVQSTATDFAHRNMPVAGQYGDVLPDSNIEMGNWNADRPEAERFKDHNDGGTPANAVRITTFAEMPLFFGAVLRGLAIEAPDALHPSSRATALLRLDKCYENGFVAGGILQMNSQNHFDAGFCVYGRGGVKMNNSNEFTAGTGVGMLNLANLNEGGNNPGLQDALVQKDLAGPPIGRAQQLIDALTAGFGPIPDYITTTAPPSNTLPDYLVPGTMYIYTASADITLSALENVAIVSHNASIKIKSNSVLRSVLLASTKSVDISSNVDIGDENYCSTGEGDSLIISGGTVTDKKEVPVGADSNISLHGVQIVAEGTMEMNSNLIITGASVQATENIVFNSRFVVAGCADESPNVTGGGTKVAQLVD